MEKVEISGSYLQFEKVMVHLNNTSIDEKPVLRVKKTPIIPVGIKKKKKTNKISMENMVSGVLNDSDEHLNEPNSRLGSKICKFSSNPLKEIINGQVQVDKQKILPEDKKPLENILSKLETVNLHLVGTNYYEDLANINDKVCFKCEYENEYDKNAIAVFEIESNQKLGYVQKEEASFFSPLIKDGQLELGNGKLIIKNGNKFLMEALCKYEDVNIERYKLERFYKPEDYIQANKHCKPLREKGIIVLSLFDGISGARVALDKSDIPVKKYYCSEIDQNCIDVVKSRYPDTINLGDVKNINEETLKDLDIDFLVGGSPCQDLSRANPEREGITGERSRLFFEYNRIFLILKEKNPNLIFLLENVWGMPSEAFYTITEHLGVYPTHLDAVHVSPCSRRRLYWSNLEIKEMKKVDVKLLSVLEDGYVWKHKSPCIIVQDRKKIVYQSKEKKYRHLTSLEEERCMGFPDNFTCIKGITEIERHEMLGNSFSIPVVSHILNEMKAPKIIKLVTKEDQEYFPGHLSTIWFDYNEYHYNS